MNLEQTTELSVSEHAQKLGHLALSLGYEGALTVGALEDEIRFYQRRSVEDVLELGKRLLLLKEMTPHGQFGNRIQLLGFSTRLAQKFMQAARKFCKSEKNSHLKNLSSLDQGRFLELVVLDDDDIQELADGGSVLDITLDDIDCMTASELRKKLREYKADLDTKDQVIKAKDQEKNKILEENTKLKSPAQIKKRAETEQQQLTKKALEELDSACATMHNDVVRFTNNINSILDAINEHGLYDIQDKLESSVVAAFQQIAQTSVELGIQIDFEAMVNPTWMATAEKSPLTGGDLEGAFADTTTELES